MKYRDETAGTNVPATTDWAVLERDEDAAREYLLSLCWPDKTPLCPRCANSKIYTLKNGRLRCASCKYTFQPFSGRWLDNGALTCSQWMTLIRVFSENAPMAESIETLGVTYNTIFKALTAIRFAILAHATDSAQLIGPETGLDSYLNGTRLTGGPANVRVDTMPVYGIMETERWVFIDLIPGFQAETLFHFHLNFHLGLVRVGNIVYSDRYKNYDTLIVCGSDNLPYDCMRKSRSPMHVDQSGSPFWKLAINNLKRMRGVSCQRFPLYLKELEFRYNNRDTDLCPLLASNLCGLVMPHLNAD